MWNNFHIYEKKKNGKKYWQKREEAATWLADKSAVIAKYIFPFSPPLSTKMRKKLLYIIFMYLKTSTSCTRKSIFAPFSLYIHIYFSLKHKRFFDITYIYVYTWCDLLSFNSVKQICFLVFSLCIFLFFVVFIMQLFRRYTYYKKKIKGKTIQKLSYVNFPRYENATKKRLRIYICIYNVFPHELQT